MSGIDAYKRTMNQTQSSRDAEYRLLGQVTAALIAAKDILPAAKADPVKMAKVADALSWNKQVWDVFVEEAAAEDNRLPKELRAAIVSLGIWVTRETLSAIDSDGAIEALIAVNKDIMKGLRPSQSQAQAAADVPADAPPPPPMGAGSFIDSA